MAVILSINIGLPGNIVLSGKRKIRSAIIKTPVEGKIFLDYLGFEGDGVGDLLRHGGGDQAVCAYPADHFLFWDRELPANIVPGAFGENLTLNGLCENDICIGDIFRVGSAEIQCAQPRQPCYKLINYLSYPAMASRIQETGFSGYYFRVIKQGWVERGATVNLLHRDTASLSVHAVNMLMYHDKKNFEKIRELIQVEALSSNWREIFNKRLIVKI